MVRREIQPGDLVLTMGAGDVWKVGDALLRADARRSKGAGKKSKKRGKRKAARRPVRVRR